MMELQTCHRPDLGHSGPCNGYPARTCWQHISTCPISRVVLTKIDDEDQGARNIDMPLVLRLGGGFETPAGDPIAYVPTHWREASTP